MQPEPSANRRPRRSIRSNPTYKDPGLSDIEYSNSQDSDTSPRPPKKSRLDRHESSSSEDEDQTDTQHTQDSLTSQDTLEKQQYQQQLLEELELGWERWRDEHKTHFSKASSSKTSTQITAAEDSDSDDHTDYLQAMNAVKTSPPPPTEQWDIKSPKLPSPVKPMTGISWIPIQNNVRDIDNKTRQHLLYEGKDETGKEWDGMFEHNLTYWDRQDDEDRLIAIDFAKHALDQRVGLNLMRQYHYEYNQHT
ncbi:hypothetical protein HK097_004797, partial [Rhizophlyctis rosea]